MYKVFKNGTHHSTHPSYADACQHARIQAAKDRQAYFTVYGEDESSTGKPLYQADAMRVLPAYIVQPAATFPRHPKQQPALGQPCQTQPENRFMQTRRYGRLP